MSNRMRVGAMCRQMRKKAGLTLMEMMGLTELSLSTLQAAEKAGRVTPRTAEKLAKVFKCDPKKLITSTAAFGER